MDAGTAAASLGIAGGVALALTLIKAIRPTIPQTFPPAIALVLVSALVGLGAWTGEVSGRPVELILLAISTAAEAVGLREVASLAASGKVVALRSDSERPT